MRLFAKGIKLPCLLMLQRWNDYSKNSSCAGGYKNWVKEQKAENLDGVRVRRRGNRRRFSHTTAPKTTTTFDTIYILKESFVSLLLPPP